MLLKVKDLCKDYVIQKGVFSNKVATSKVLKNVSFELHESSILGILGETGSGKTTLAKCIAGLFAPTSGEIHFSFENVRRFVQMIFQNPYSSLNPRIKIKNALTEPFLIHKLPDRAKRINEILHLVNLDESSLNRYPDEFSGGQKQRISIARAISMDPKILICDEPTASLDVSMQSQILNLFLDLKDHLKLSYVFISHDIEVISFIADQVLILYDGIVVERGKRKEVIKNPLHPYTKMLLDNNPLEESKEIPGNSDVDGCVFYSRCPKRMEICLNRSANEQLKDKNHYVNCHLYK